MGPTRGSRERGRRRAALEAASWRGARERIPFFSSSAAEGEQPGTLTLTALRSARRCDHGGFPPHGGDEDAPSGDASRGGASPNLPHPAPAAFQIHPRL
ncbi:hypothetical protein ZWY2020_045706 [Hordeum vulgare]|nr:hypothetical protein ZWY2020_045706 [Hordeum vulgare]